MKKNTFIIYDIISISLFILVIIGDIILSSNKPVVKDSKDAVKEDVIEQEPTKEEVIKEEIIQEEIEEQNPVESNISTPKEKVKQEIKQNYNNNNQVYNKPVDNTPTASPVVEDKPKEPSYSCPDGYVLSGTTCTQTFDALYECPTNTTSFSDEDIPRDTYCINLSEGIKAEEDTCPSGYGKVMQISLGGPSTYYCYPLHIREYKCNDGYVLNNTYCIRTIDAISN